AIYISHHPDFAPLALHESVEQIKELHQKVVIVSVQVSQSAHIPSADRALFSTLRYADGISSLSLTYGYHDVINVPKTLQSLRPVIPELNFDSSHASYFVSSSKLRLTKRRNLARWRKGLYQLMARNARSNSDYYHLPIERTIEMQALLRL
ncbi:MAG: hypothetical protein ACHQTE_01235, partial [Candidatus Saccharimonadales bacterium]